MSSLIIAEMLAEYRCKSNLEYVNALREIMQNIALMSLARHQFFSHAAFYGGTALRILYGLDRGSEDLDFSLLAADDRFELSHYASGLEDDFAAFGMRVGFSEKLKMTESHIRSGFLKSNTQALLLSVGAAGMPVGHLNAREELRIKLEVDVQPPPGFGTELKYLYRPLPFPVRAYVLPDLLAGKLHAVLFRNWRNRVKGRDWYDLIWYAGNHPEYRLKHLEERSRQSGHYLDKTPFTHALVMEMLRQRLEAVDIEQMKEDVRPFVRDAFALSIWSKNFFLDAFKRLTAV